MSIPRWPVSGAGARAGGARWGGSPGAAAVLAVVLETNPLVSFLFLFVGIPLYFVDLQDDLDDCE